MAPSTVSAFLSACAEHAGTALGRLCARHPARTRRVLLALERAGVQVGWALLALEIEGGGR